MIPTGNLRMVALLLRGVGLCQGSFNAASLHHDLVLVKFKIVFPGKPEKISKVLDTHFCAGI